MLGNSRIPECSGILGQFLGNLGTLWEHVSSFAFQRFMSEFSGKFGNSCGAVQKNSVLFGKMFGNSKLEL